VLTFLLDLNLIMKLKSLLFLFVVPVFAFAQSNYKPGYVVKNSGDTVKGYINYREWDQSPQKIEFKNQLQSKEVINFTPGETKSFTIDGLENYISYIGPISMDKSSFPDLPSELDTTKMVDTVYLRVIATGPNVSLFINRDKIKTRFFYKEDGSPLQELVYHQYYLDGQNVHEVKTYAGQLIILLHKYRQGDESDEERIWTSRFTEFELGKAINIINNVNNLPQKIKGNNSSGTRFFVALGANYSKLKFEGDNSFSTPSSNKSSISPYLGAGIDVFNNPNVQKIVFRAEVFFFRTSGNITSMVPLGGVLYDRQNYQMEQYTGTISPQIIYNLYNSNLFKFYLSIGVGLNFSIYPTNKITMVEENYTSNKAYDLKPYWTSFPLQAGALINKKIEVFFMYLKNTAFTDYISYSISSDSFNAGLRYHFTKSK